MNRWTMERVNNGNIASETLALVAVQCAVQVPAILSPKKIMLWWLYFQKYNIRKKRKCSSGCIFGRNGLEDWPKGEVTHERKLSRAH